MNTFFGNSEVPTAKSRLTANFFHDFNVAKTFIHITIAGPPGNLNTARSDDGLYPILQLNDKVRIIKTSVVLFL